VRRDSLSEAARCGLGFLQCEEMLYPDVKFWWGLFWFLVTCENFSI